MTSISIMIQRIKGLHGTKDVSDWEGRFIGSVWDKTACGKDATGLSSKQIEIIERIHDKHFA